MRLYASICSMEEDNSRDASDSTGRRQIARRLRTGAVSGEVLRAVANVIGSVALVAITPLVIRRRAGRARQRSTSAQDRLASGECVTFGDYLQAMVDDGVLRREY